jgi:hypothetical protein
VKSTTLKRSGLWLSNFCTSKIIMLSTTLLYGFSTENMIWFIKQTAQQKQCVQPKTAINKFQLLYNSRIPRSRDLNYSNALPFVRVKLIKLGPTSRLTNFSSKSFSALKLSHTFNKCIHHVHSIITHDLDLTAKEAMTTSACHHFITPIHRLCAQ